LAWCIPFPSCLGVLPIPIVSLPPPIPWCHFSGCMYVCMHGCMHVYELSLFLLFLCTPIPCMYVWMHVCMYACMYVCMYSCTTIPCMLVCICYHVYPFILFISLLILYLSTIPCIHACMLACLLVFMHACMYAYRDVLYSFTLYHLFHLHPHQSYIHILLILILTNFHCPTLPYSTLLYSTCTCTCTCTPNPPLYCISLLYLHPCTSPRLSINSILSINSYSPWWVLVCCSSHPFILSLHPVLHPLCPCVHAR
jgi:hypothetical protein